MHGIAARDENAGDEKAFSLMSMYVDAYLASQHRRSYLEGGWRSPGHLEWSPRRGMRPARANRGQGGWSAPSYQP